MNALFFDRDGVINRSPGRGKYVTSWGEFHFSDGIFDALRAVHEAGFAAILVTSQRGVARGLMDSETLDEIHRRMQETLVEKAGGGFLDIFACTHEIGTCNCRKPSPEMIRRAAVAHGIDLTGSWLVGDHDRDIEMAHHAGVPAPHTIRIRGDHEITFPAAYTLSSTAELADFLRKHLPC